ncbi:hypothetical protein RRG08_007397 [Elysia crispata]|uniref:Uncharacterized protein n=1 Tax=Elysia crispata TaxID=231223 RepID=A0AAE1A421_9GAST|nr:hypothetical protein RRG08_007397 [Elysia crispata]
MTIYHHLRPSTTTYDHLPPLTTIYHHLRPSTTTYDHLPPLTTIYHHLRPSTTIYDHLHPTFHFTGIQPTHDGRYVILENAHIPA